MTRTFKGSGPAIRKEIRINPDLLAELEAAIAAGRAKPLTEALEAGARLWLKTPAKKV
jgi:hypothetical protein